MRLSKGLEGIGTKRRHLLLVLLVLLLLSKGGWAEWQRRPWLCLFVKIIALR